MGYRDDLIRRMQTEGGWGSLTDEERHRFERMSDEEAGRLMAIRDWSEMDDPESLGTVGLSVAHDGLKVLCDIFNGRLLMSEGDKEGTLSTAGLLLCQFIEELERQGVHWAMIPEELSKLNNVSAVYLLRQMYKKRRRD